MIHDQDVESRIIRNPEILRGKPIIRGTRIPADLMAGFVANGLTPAEIVADYPDLTTEDVDAATTFVAGEMTRIEVRRW